MIALLKQRGDETAEWIASLSDSFLAEPFTQPAGTDAGDEDAVRDDHEHEGARDAPPRRS